MGMPDLVHWTREQVLSLPEDGKRHELIDGELIVTPSPAMRHQAVVSALFGRLVGHVDANGLGRMLTSPADLFANDGQIAQPDLFVVPTRLVGDWSALPAPSLVVEVLSPSTARYDRVLKRRFYQRMGVPEYWIVDVDARMVERWRPDDERPEIVEGVLRWAPLTDAVPLDIDLARLFGEALDG
jgi:Uma2 family endonuclease